MSRSDLDQAVYDTIRYFAVFDLPVTAVQIWRSLIIDAQDTGLAAVATQQVSLHEIRLALAHSDWLKERVTTEWGYYCLRSVTGGRHSDVKQYIRERLWRHVLAQEKWKIARQVAGLLVGLPFVRMVAGSGSLALFNTKPSSDLDLYFVVQAGRIWTARLFILLVTQLTGRRRRYWDERAPDKICLNHYVTDQSLVMPLANRTVYTAQLYAFMEPLWGLLMYRRWLGENEVWMRRWLGMPPRIIMPSRLSLHPRPAFFVLQRLFEAWLLEPIGNSFERWAELMQRRVIEAHTKPGQVGRVVVSDQELAFHPDTQAPSVLQRYQTYR